MVITVIKSQSCFYSKLSHLTLCLILNSFDFETFSSDFIANYNGSVWGWNGPNLVTRVLRRICNEDLQTGADEIHREIQCKNFTIFPPQKCYEIHFTELAYFFRTKLSKVAMERISKSYFVHTWNSMSKEIKLQKSSTAAYIKLAEQFCPSVLHATKDFF